MSDQSTRFAASPNPGREKISFEASHYLADQLTDFAASAFKRDISLNRSEIIRAALTLALPVFHANPNMVTYINQNMAHSNQKNG